MNGSINFDTGAGNYAYCLDGKRLMSVTPTSCPGGVPEYRTELESYTRVCHNGNNTFKAWTKSGLIMEYGTTTDSMIEPAGYSNGSVITWALAKVQDTKGNYMTVSYGEDWVNGEFWPTRIDYTGNAPTLTPYASVEFVYAANLAESYQIRAYIGGSPLRVSRAMSAIEMKQGTSIARRYDFTYEWIGAAYRPRMTSVTEKGYDTGSGTWITKQPTTFQYNGNAVAASNLEAGSYSYTDNPHSFASGGYSGMASYLGDFNGDGKLDIFWQRESEGRKGVADPTPTARIWMGVGPSNTSIIESSGVTDCAPIVGDFNGDGYSDILWYPKTTLYNKDGDPIGPKNCGAGAPILIWLSNGNGTFLNVTAPGTSSFYATYGGWATWRPFLGDFNGDGKTDVLWVNMGDAASTDDPVYFWHGGGNATFTLSNSLAIPNDSAPSLGDFNGDGVTDILWDQKLADGRSSGYRTLWVSTGTGAWTTIPNVAGYDGTHIGWAPVIVDANGDGKADIFWDYRYADGRSAGYRSVWLGKGNGQFEGFFNVLGQDLNFIGWTLTPGNFNGDGKTDLLWDQRDTNNKSIGGYRYIWMSLNGSVWNAQAEVLGATNVYALSTQLIADFNGDGKSDVIFDVTDLYGRSQSTLALYTSVVPKQDLLTKVTDGMKLETTFSHKPLSDSAGRYTKGTGAAYPQADLIGPLHVVIDKIIDFGHPYAGGTHTTKFYYSGARAELRGRGFLGFSQVIAEDGNNATWSRTTNRQDYPHIGSPSLVESFASPRPSTSQLVGSVANTYAEQSLGGTRYLPYLSDSTAIKKDLDGAFISRTRTQNSTPDSFGNIGQISVYSQTEAGAPDGFSTITNNQYSNDSTNWILGRLTCAAVTKAIPGTQQIRASAFSYESTTGLLATETIEPGTACGSVLPTSTDPAVRLITEYVYDTWGNVTTKTIMPSVGVGAPGYFLPRTTTTSYDPYHRAPETITNDLNHTETRLFDGAKDGYSSITDVNGITTTITHDSLGRKTREVTPTKAGNSVETLYSFVHYGTADPAFSFWLQSIQQIVGTTTEVRPRAYVAYDRLGRGWRPLGMNMDGTWTETGEKKDYDAWGRVTIQYRPLPSGGSQAYGYTTYDVLGRPLANYDPHHSIANTLAAVPTTFAYNGRITTITNPKGQITEQEVNSQGQLIRVTQAKGTSFETTLNFDYDPFGNRKKVTRVTGNFTHITNITFDIRGRKVLLDDPDTGPTSYVYDALGQLVSQTDAKNQTTTLNYDALGRVTQRTEPDHISNFYFDTIQAECSPTSKVIGRQTRSTTTTGYEQTTCFDEFARPLTDTTTLGYLGGPSLTTTTIYDAAGRVDRMSYPSGFEIQNVYGPWGHHTQIKNYNGGAALWTLNALDGYGHVTSETAGSGSGARQTLRSYDLVGRLTTLKVGTAGNPTLLENATLGYDAIHNVTSRSWYGGAGTHSESFTLDALNRLTGIVGSTSFAYDLRGNLTSKTDVGTLAYPGTGAARPHALSAVTGTVNGVVNPTYEYDANGNLLYEKEGGTTNRRALTWSSFNMPTQIAYTPSAGTGATSSFWYGPGHERVKQVLVAGSTTTTTYYLHGPQYEEVTVGSTTTKKAYIRAGGRIVALAETVSGSTAIKYFHGDHLASTSIVTDANGAVIERLSYDAWGKRRNTDGSAGTISAQHNRGFTGHEHLDAVNFIHMNGRVYDPALGRFISADPIIDGPENSQSYNRYSYVNNNPLTYTDPSGYWKIKIGPIKFGKSSDLKLLAGIGLAYFLGPYLNLTGGAIGNGFVGGFASGLVMTGDIEGGIRGGITGGLFGWAGTAGDGVWAIERFAAHAIAGCVSGELGGGGCGRGAVSAVTGKFATNITDGSFVATVIAAGTVSVIGGGKFSNGASTATFGYLFNYLSTTARAAPLVAELRKDPTMAKILDAMHADTTTNYVIDTDSLPESTGGGRYNLIPAPRRGLIDFLMGRSSLPTFVMTVDPASQVRFTDISGVEFLPDPVRRLSHELGHGYTYLRGDIGGLMRNRNQAIIIENNNARFRDPNAPVRSFSDHGRVF